MERDTRSMEGHADRELQDALVETAGRMTPHKAENRRNRRVPAHAHVLTYARCCTHALYRIPLPAAGGAAVARLTPTAASGASIAMLGETSRIGLPGW